MPQVMQCKVCSTPMPFKVVKKEGDNCGKYFVSCPNNCKNSFRFVFVNGQAKAPRNPDGSINDSAISGGNDSGQSNYTNAQVLQAAQQPQYVPQQQQQNYHQQTPNSPVQQVQQELGGTDEITLKRAVVESLLASNKLNSQHLIVTNGHLVRIAAAMEENAANTAAMLELMQMQQNPKPVKKPKFTKEPAFETEEEQQDFIAASQQAK